MSNNPTDDRPRKRTPRQGAGSDQNQRQTRARNGQQEAGSRQLRQRGERQGLRRARGGGGGEHQERQRAPKPARLSREEIEWARDLWLHREPPDEIAQQLGVEIEEIEALIAGWQQQQAQQ